MMNMKTSAMVMLTAVILVGAGMMIFNNDGKTKLSVAAAAAGNVSVVDGTQVIGISAKGGYSPRQTSAEAGIPTIIRMTTSNTFDCSSALSIPYLSVQTHLAPSGTREFVVPPQEPGTKIQGLCSMGMYNFVIYFN